LRCIVLPRYLSWVPAFSTQVVLYYYIVGNRIFKIVPHLNRRCLVIFKIWF
jgi:hypothetical protein